MSTPLHHLTIEEAADGLANGSFSSVDITKACLDQIKKIDPQINSYIAVEEELALAQAKASDERRAKGESKGVLDGIPYNLKDVYATKDTVSTAASHILEGWKPPYNATVYQKLSDAGAVLLGKTNTDEFTMGVSTETSYFGVTKNPWDLERVAGGSSGGPTASIAAHLGIFSIGTDTGGSIRQPAAFCGVTGLRPTYGRISRFGEIAMASSLDQTGPVTKTARDAAIVLHALAGHDHLDATSSPEADIDFVAHYPESDKPLKNMDVGVAKEYFGEGVLPDVEARTREAIAVLEKLGANIVELSLPSISYALAAYYIIAPAEVSSNMARYDGIRYGYSVERAEPHKKHTLYDIYAKSRAAGLGAEVKRRIMLGTHVLSAGYYDAYYKQAEKVRAVVSDQFKEAFTKVHVLAAPVSPHPAFKIGAQLNDPLAMYKEDILTVPVNIGGVPGISIPAGFVNNLPVGLQLIAPRFDEEHLLRASIAYQDVTDHHRQLPPILQTNT